MQQVLAFFSCLMKNLGNNIEFVVQQTSDDGMVVGVSWKLGFPSLSLLFPTMPVTLFSCKSVAYLLFHVSSCPQSGIRFLCLWEKVSVSTCAMFTKER